ncbi:hypothetical protein QA635_32505 [Bradyrhizobium brasilense]|uniref:hypothetical protein n=1 Tax=Bradyrhizobium brasilense TaxID=1419277 RepID=UPI0024B04606|nr:hypothetical protein [Bradyrhizobium australafricanum]WFU31248.1 hypothetical protein QA635_32505 [Bradyrhizobium australafricanum]
MLYFSGIDAPGTGHFIRNEVILSEKREGHDWKPQSSFAKLIAAYAPDSWFDLHPTDQKASEGARKSLAK